MLLGWIGRCILGIPLSTVLVCCGSIFYLRGAQQPKGVGVCEDSGATDARVSQERASLPPKASIVEQNKVGFSLPPCTSFCPFHWPRALHFVSSFMIFWVKNMLMLHICV
ncbi:hypothetical protein BS78_01G298400 [Paspalum vaginatum]|nr:hypothetical protein BS78_01G298400 [Paspalum vaginatum]